MRELLEYMVKNLVDMPEEVNINEIRTSNGVVLEIFCNESDRGKIIGKQGRAIQAIRFLMSLFGTRAGQRVQVEIVE